MRRLHDLLKRFRRDESGAFLVIFAVIALVLIATSGAVVDFTYMQTARSRAQNALDAAALALQTKMSTYSVATLKSKALDIMNERLADTGIVAVVNTATPDTTNGKLYLQAQITVPTAFVQLVGIKTITAQLQSEVTQGSKNLEISLALDTTGSMAGSKIQAARDATNWLINNVIKDQQPPTVPNYTRMAIVPWSAAVKPGSYLTSVRGSTVGGTAITGITWMKTTTVNISSITKASPAVITTSSAHGLQTGDTVYISGVSGMTQLPSGLYKVTKNSSTQVKLLKLDGTNYSTIGYSTYSNTTPAKITGCLVATTCNLRVTSANHGLATNDNVFLKGIGGLTALNDAEGYLNTNGATVHPVGATTTSTFDLGDESPLTVGYTAYTSGGTANCVKYGCYRYYFSSYTRNYWGGTSTGTTGYSIFYPSNCVTERYGTHAFDDAGPSTAYVGINYTNDTSTNPLVGQDCVSQAVQPLTSDKTVLGSVATSLNASGSTSGHLGLAWGWYMLDPNFSTVWPIAPAAYSTNNLIKVVVLMTDGAFNLQYCNGVITEDPADSFYYADTLANCSPNNGYSRAQAQALCDAIKVSSNHILLYTLGFDLGTDTDSLNFLQGCATPDPGNKYFIQADTTAELQAGFEEIARNLNTLRLSK